MLQAGRLRKCEEELAKWKTSLNNWRTKPEERNNCNYLIKEEERTVTTHMDYLKVYIEPEEQRFKCRTEPSSFIRPSLKGGLNLERALCHQGVKICAAFALTSRLPICCSSKRVIPGIRNPTAKRALFCDQYTKMSKFLCIYSGLAWLIIEMAMKGWKVVELLSHFMEAFGSRCCHCRLRDTSVSNGRVVRFNHHYEIPRLESQWPKMFWNGHFWSGKQEFLSYDFLNFPVFGRGVLLMLASKFITPH